MVAMKYLVETRPRTHRSAIDWTALPIVAKSSTQLVRGVLGCVIHLVRVFCTFRHLGTKLVILRITLYDLMQLDPYQMNILVIDHCHEIKWRWRLDVWAPISSTTVCAIPVVLGGRFLSFRPLSSLITRVIRLLEKSWEQKTIVTITWYMITWLHDIIICPTKQPGLLGYISGI